MRWRSAATGGLVSLTVLAAAASAQAETADMGAVGFVNAGRAPVDRTDFFVGVQTAQGLLTSNVRSYAVPSGYGVITEWSHFAGSASGPLGFGVMRRFPDGEYTSTATAVRRVTAGQLHRFATRMPVRRGDQLVLASENQGGQPRLRLFYLGGLPNTVSELTDYNVGNGQPALRRMRGRLLAVAARVETDADGDGYGDDTQDACPTRADIQVACPDGGQDAEKPKIEQLTLRPTAFRTVGSGRAFAPRSNRPVGTQGEFVASEGGSLRFRVTSRTGRRVGGSFTVDATQGLNAFAFSGSVGGRKLGPGSYRLVGVASDRAGNTTALPPLAFRIVP